MGSAAGGDGEGTRDIRAGSTPRARTPQTTLPLAPEAARAVSKAAQALAPTQEVDVDVALAPAAEAKLRERASVSDGALITPERAMLYDEAHRLRAFSGFLAALSVLTLAMLAALGGDPTAKAMHGGAVAVTGLFSAAYWLVARDARTYKPAHALGLAHIAMLANISGFYYWGVFGPYAAIVPVASYVFATGASRGVFWSGLVISIATHAALGIAIITGALPDRGLFQPAAAAGTPGKVAALALIDLVLLGSVMLARRARASTEKVLMDHHAAVRGLAQREAQLAEAHAEMRQVQAAAGRFSGQRVARFLLGDVLGRGAMGEVYAATADDGERCAVKLLAPARLLDDEAHRRFQREVRVAAGLASPHVVRVVEVSPPDAALPYLAMERLEGVDLAALIKEKPVRPLAEVVTILTQVAAGLDAAHAAGIVHRDLKPQNLFAAGPPAAPTWKVLDFGISKLAHEGGTLTRDHVIGTPGYMAPEQAKSEAVDARTDVYALGVLAYRLLTGVPAVMPGDVHSMLYEVVYRMPPQPRSFVEVPADVEAVLAVAIAKAPADRFASAGELARALAAAAGGKPVPDLPVRASAVLAKTPWGHWLRRDRAR
jgi:serine/threonine-protein kinase